MQQFTHPPGTARHGTDGGPEDLRLRRVEVGLILGFWTFLALLTAANRLLGPRAPGLPPPPASAAVALAFAESYLWAALTPPLFWLTRRFGLERPPRLSRVALYVAVGLLIAVFVDVADDFLRIEVFRLPRPGQLEFQPSRSLTHFWFLNELITCFAVLSAGLARNYFLRYRQRREQAVRLQAEAARLQAQLTEARLSALQTQLNPHFLFNTLHAVSALVERDPAGVRRMIARLGELLRHTLEGAHEQEVTLERELAFVERYLEIMRIRFQGRLEVQTDVDPQVLDAIVPSLVLQPLVENAIKHGVGEREGTGWIRIEARREGGSVRLSVRDSGPWRDPAGHVAEDGIGLRNTRARLLQLYGEAQSLSLARAEEGGAEARVTLPYRTRAELRVAGA